jgi:predicted alpha/beta hydrolase
MVLFQVKGSKTDRKKRWEDNIHEWSGLDFEASLEVAREVAGDSEMVIWNAPTTS